jgi:hypothetical protein
MRCVLPSLSLAFFGLACNSDMPTGARASPTAPSFAVAGNSGCYTVVGTITETGVFPNFAGTIAGDLVGTSNTSLSFDVSSTGVVIKGPGERTLTITGGNVPQLIGLTLHETFEGLTIFEGHPVILLNERTRIDMGAQSGNLTTHGTLDLSTFPWQLEVEYRGVICP